MNCLPPFLRCRFHSRLAVLLDAVVFDSTDFARAVTLCHFDKNVSFALLFIFSLTLDTGFTFLTFLLLKARQVDLDFGKVDLQLGKVDLHLGQVELYLGQVDLDLGEVDLGLGQVDLRL